MSRTHGIDCPFTEGACYREDCDQLNERRDQPYCVVARRDLGMKTFTVTIHNPSASVSSGRDAPK